MYWRDIESLARDSSVRQREATKSKTTKDTKVHEGNTDMQPLSPMAFVVLHLKTSGLIR